MITILLVCIFFGINVRVYFNFEKMQCVAQVILPGNLHLISFRLNLFNKTLFYKINGGKDKQIIIKKSDKKAKKQFKKITIHSVSYSLVVGSSEDCVKGLYISKVVGYITAMVANLSENYIEIEHYDSFVLPDFRDNNSTLVLNVVIKKGIIDIIKNIFARRVKKEYEVSYANW